MEISILLIPVMFLLNSIISGFFINKLEKNKFDVIVNILPLFGLLLSIYLVTIFTLYEQSVLTYKLYPWINIEYFSANIGYLIDQMSSVMIFVVCSISFFVHIYSTGYMTFDKDYSRFFSYISFFTFAMLLLVMSDNFIQMFIGWEGVGLASYLLIGFWHSKASAISANLKAFLVNRIGDLFFIIGVVIIFSIFNSFNFSVIFDEINYLKDPNDLANLELACLFLFIGAMAKSAQIPLHIWLPDSMEGPTPISALIHAATMVTAGIFLIIRLSPIYEVSTYTMDTILIIGAITSLLLGIVGIYQNDIKKVIAYSTISQLGYMICILGAGFYAASFFHLFTHAFFKALLFLSAGAVIISMHHEQDIRKMGNLRAYLPITYKCFLIGTLCLVGFPLTSGFFSKDLILISLYNDDNFLSLFSYVVLVIGTFVTSMYSFRLLFLVFHGDERFKGQKITEQGLSMLIPLVILSVLAVISGACINFFLELNIYSTENKNISYSGILDFILHGILSLPTLFILIAFWISKKLYLDEKPIQNNSFIIGKILSVVKNKFYFDEIFFSLANTCIKIGSFFSNIIDHKLIDQKLIIGIPKIIDRLSFKAKKIQTGYLYHSAFSIIFSLVIILAILMYRI
ncbi:MAG: NADH-quinone oxidoreductase subunit L [Pseudomonadota bacterium]|nr:NADH-quinone oxidoreductase subunit L [Pseudomonadota bacterium]|tara:strand:+ start:1493 stop:3376 length:1884 start_codon:yes stop_codon:yes gene_type:complete